MLDYFENKDLFDETVLAYKKIVGIWRTYRGSCASGTDQENSISSIPTKLKDEISEVLAELHDKLQETSKLDHVEWERLQHRTAGVFHDMRPLLAAMMPFIRRDQLLRLGSYGRYLDKTPEDAKQSQVEHIENQNILIRLITDNIRSAENIGSIFRTSECFRVDHIYICGYSPLPSEPKVKKVSMGTESWMNWSWSIDTLDPISKCKEQGFEVYALEKSTSSVAYHSIAFPRKVALLVGNERHGILPESLKLADRALEIPMLGRKNSLNVNIATSVLLAHLRIPS